MLFDNARKIFLVLCFLDVIFVVLHVLFGEQFDLFHLDRERTFVAYYSGAQLMGVAALGVVAGLLSRPRFLRWGWMGVATLFLLLGFDEISELHENITYYVLAYGAGIIEEISFFRSPTYNWLVILSPFIVLTFFLLFFFSRRIRIQNSRAHQWFLCGLLLYVGALGLELAGGLVTPFEGPIKLFVIEELIEMLASSVLIRSLLLFVLTLFRTQYERR